MRRVWLVLLCIFLGITACNSIYPPAQVLPGDIYEQIATPAPIGYEAGRVWVWTLGTQTDKGVIAFDFTRYLSREIALLVGAVMIGLVSRRYPRRTERAIAWSGQRMWLIPLAFYSVAAIARLVFVPCFWVLLRAYEMRPEITDVETMPVWQVGVKVVFAGHRRGLVHIRYGLVFYEEIVLLACLAAWYAAASALSPSIRAKVSSLH